MESSLLSAEQMAEATSILEESMDDQPDELETLADGEVEVGIEEEPKTETEDAEEFEGQPDEEPSDQPKYKVKVDGKELEVTLDELMQGYSKESDYRQKTQALAEERRRLDPVVKLADLIEQDKQLQRMLQDYLFRRKTGAPYTPQGARQMQLEHENRYLKAESQIREFVERTPDITEEDLIAIATTVREGKASDLDAAYRLIKYDAKEAEVAELQKQIEELKAQTRSDYASARKRKGVPVLKGGGAPSESVKSIETLEDAKNAAIAYLNSINRE